MKIEISYPGQEITVIEAANNVKQHYATKNYNLPFHRVITEKPTTKWFRLMKDKDGNESWEFNHIEDGYCLDDKPTQKHPSHAQVWNGKWKKEFVQASLTEEGSMRLHRE